LATLVFEANYGAGPAWTAIASVGQLVGFYGANFNDKVAVNSYQSSTHVSGGASVDVCTINHAKNVTYVDGTHFNTTGAGNTVLNDTNLIAANCTLRVHLNHSSQVYTQNGRFYVYNGTTVTSYAPDITAYAFEQGQSATAWTQVCNGTSQGGDNSGQRLTLSVKGSYAYDQYWYVAMSCMPMSVGAKTAFSVGSTIEYY
jgi:hypothetical protein